MGTPAESMTGGMTPTTSLGFPVGGRGYTTLSPTASVAIPAGMVPVPASLAAADAQAVVCSNCGNVFMDDANFCRKLEKCGRRSRRLISRNRQVLAHEWPRLQQLQHLRLSQCVDTPSPTRMQAAPPSHPHLARHLGLISPGMLRRQAAQHAILWLISLLIDGRTT